MAKPNDTKKSIDYTEEDMSETEEYFQKTSPTNNTSKQASTDNSFELLNTEKVNDGVTIGVLPIDKGESETEFDDFLFESVDETLSTLGGAIKNAVYFHLQTNFCMNKNEIPKRIYEFSNIIHKIFGSGAGRLEIKMMKTLHSKINVSVSWPEYEAPLSKWLVMDVTFTEYVTNMRETYEANAKKLLIVDQKTVE